MPKMKENEVHAYRTEAIEAAKDLCYGPKVIDMIKNARNDVEIANIMADARMGKIRRD